MGKCWYKLNGFLNIRGKCLGTSYGIRGKINYYPNLMGSVPRGEPVSSLPYSIAHFSSRRPASPQSWAPFWNKKKKNDHRIFGFHQPSLNRDDPDRRFTTLWPNPCRWNLIQSGWKSENKPKIIMPISCCFLLIFGQNYPNGPPSATDLKKKQFTDRTIRPPIPVFPIDFLPSGLCDYPTWRSMQVL